MSTSPSAPLQYSSLVANSSNTAAAITLPQKVSVNMTGLPLSDGTPSNFTVYAWVRWNCPSNQTGGYYDIFTTGDFHLMWTPTGNLFGCFATVQQLSGGQIPDVQGITLPSGVFYADGNWHSVALSYEQFQNIAAGQSYPANQPVGQFWLYVDGNLWATEIMNYGSIPSPVSNASLSATVYPITPLDFYNTCEIASLSISAKAESNDELGIQTVWGKRREGDFVADFDFANGGAVDESGNGATAVVNNQFWFTPCLQSSCTVNDTNGAATFPSGTSVNPGGDGDFSAMGWICFPDTVPGSATPNNTASISLFSNQINGINLSAVLAYDGTNLSISLTDMATNSVTSSSFPWQLWTFVAVTFNSKDNTYNFYNNGIKVGTGTLTPWWSTSGSSNFLSIGVMTAISGSNPPFDINPAANLQAVSFWSTPLSQNEISTLADSDPTGETTCLAYFPLNTVFANLPSTITSPDGTRISLTDYSMSDTVSGIVLQVSTLSINSAVLEMQLPCTTANTSAAFARKTVSATATSNEPRIMTYSDHLAHAVKLGIDTKAKPSAEMLADPEFKELVQWYDSMLKDTDPKMASLLRERFARNLNIGKQLAKKAPGIGSHSFVTKADKVTWMYQTPEGPVHFAEMMASPGTIAMDVFNLILSGSGILMSILGVKASAKALSKGAEKIIPKNSYGTFGSIVKKAYSSSKKDAETAKEMIMIMIEMGLKLGDLGAAMWAYISDMSWWDMILTVGGLIVWVASIILTAGGAAALAFIAKLILLIIAIVAFVKDVKKLIDDLGSNSPEPNPSAAIA